MHRRKWGMAAFAVVLLVSGCCNPDRPGLFARLRERRASAERAQCAPCGNSVEIPVAGGPGFPGMPVVPGGSAPCPCQGMPGPGVEAGPEYIMPQRTPEGIGPIPTRPMPPATPPGNATPNPAGPSGESTGLRKGIGAPPVTKPLISP